MRRGAGARREPRAPRRFPRSRPLRLQRDTDGSAPSVGLWRSLEREGLALSEEQKQAEQLLRNAVTLAPPLVQSPPE